MSFSAMPLLFVDVENVFFFLAALLFDFGQSFCTQPELTTLSAALVSANCFWQRAM